jgi:TonB-dependent receptor
MSSRVILVVACLMCALSGVFLRSFAQESSPPSEAPGTIAGSVIDEANAEPLVDAGVEVVGRGITTRTNVDGRFVIKIAPGTYEVRVFAPLYRSLRVQNVVVRPNQTTEAEVSLTSSGQAGIEVVEVVALRKATEEAQLAKRQKSSELRDTISAEAMKKAGGGSAADIVAQAPSVVVKDDKYINIRGLQERYTGALLNQSRLPSTDPQRRVVPLDLFPAGFLDSISIVKSYTPNLPGDFSGGLVELELRDFPSELGYSLGISTGGNSQSTFDDFQTYRGAPADYFGWGTEFRELAAGTPGRQDALDKESPLARARLGRQFRNIWNIDNVEAPPNFGVAGSIGNRYGPFGFQLGTTYGNQYRRRRNEIANNFTNLSPDPFKPSDAIGINDSVLYSRSAFQTKLGSIFTAGYDISPTQRIAFRSLYNRNSSDQVYLGNGFRRNATDIPVRQQTLRYTMEELYWLQLSGEHRWSWINADWRSAYSRSTQKEPDTRFFTQIGQAGPDPEPFSYVTDSLSGTRLFNDLQEWLSDSALDFTIPFKTGLPFTDVWSGLPASFKFGPAYSFRSRGFSQRRFRLRPASDCGTDASACLDPTLPPQELFAPSNIGLGGFDFVEETQPRDSYRVSQEIAAFYAMFELPIVRDRLRVIGGTRYEYSFIRLNIRNDLNEPETVILNNKNPIPGVSVVYSPRDDMNVRLAYGHTVSRPDFRELSPAQYLAPLGEIQTQGNPFLVQAIINSYDARWEWFFGPLELVSFSVFHKKLNRPIEETLLPQGSNPLQTWINGDKATLTGFEFEGRKNLGFLSRPLRFLGRVAPQLQYMSVQANVTYAGSNVTVPRDAATIGTSVVTVQTNTERPLQGQAPFITNAALEYSHPTIGTARLAYSTTGDYIVLVGANGLPDVMNERRNQLDLVLIKPLKDWVGLPLTASLNIENILNQRVNWSLGQGVASPDDGGPTGTISRNPGVQSGTVKRFTTGVGFSFNLSYSF